jgi:hypothetical protein
MKTLIGIYVRLIYAYRALKQINHPHLGDIVTYRGYKYYLNQGVNAPYWDLAGADNPFFESCVYECNFKLQPLWRRFFFSFRFTYRFYMRSWYMIDVNNRGRFIFRPFKGGHLWRKK